ncbi:OLC1v1037617C1 [Oldenlandia corymbosa var. corymbosa]|uniref:Meiotic nuclear division protein 1 homolog n=1 Tax=Oldenlandia corymbosa var. corymbosa TaxID=529605 RepID=A0AAV1CYS3_OLDCO|nr:OLC1v1037617C1 [Oldenlandia corymbosa var. corymbosa]
MQRVQLGFLRTLLACGLPDNFAEKMSKKRGLSLEEKREKMLQIFYDSQDFYLLKELEKLGPKKGVISQSVKDVIQSLVDDDLVSKDKIGTSVYFWSLPSCAGNQLRNIRRKLESDLQSGNNRLSELTEQCESLKKGREESDERDKALEELKEIEQKHNELKNELGKYAENDPATFETKKKAIEVAHAAANRWTDNIFTLRQWCSNNFPQAKEQLDNLYNEVGVTDEFDYLELPAVPVAPIEQTLETYD